MADILSDISKFTHLESVDEFDKTWERAWCCLFGFDGISTFVGYLMPNPIFIQINSSISSNSVEHIYTVLLSKTFLFQTIQFSQTSLFQTIQ